jgi:hypothetical protein
MGRKANDRLSQLLALYHDIVGLRSQGQISSGLSSLLKKMDKYISDAKEEAAKYEPFLSISPVDPVFDLLIQKSGNFAEGDVDAQPRPPKRIKVREF